MEACPLWPKNAWKREFLMFDQMQRRFHRKYSQDVCRQSPLETPKSTIWTPVCRFVIAFCACPCVAEFHGFVLVFRIRFSAEATPKQLRKSMLAWVPKRSPIHAPTCYAANTEVTAARPALAGSIRLVANCGNRNG